MKHLLHVSAAVTCMCLSPIASFATTVSGLFAAPDTVTGMDSSQGNVVALAFESFGTTIGSVTAASPVVASFTATINPYLTALSGGGFSNSITLGYSLNGGSLVNLSIIPVAGVGATSASGILLGIGDTLNFQISGSAGRSGNQVTFNVLTDPYVPPMGTVPIAPAGALLVSGLGGLMLAKRRKN